jgi:hypothetical protein
VTLSCGRAAALTRSHLGCANVLAGVTAIKADLASRIVLVLRARPGTQWSTVRYGIESYFVPEEQGPRLDKSGNADIKGLIIDGKLQYEEPLFLTSCGRDEPPIDQEDTNHAHHAP